MIQSRDATELLQLSAGDVATVSVRRERPWASQRFSGTRLTLSATGDDDDRLDEWLIALPDLELPLPGHFVASAEVIERSAKAAAIELLVVES